MKNKLELFILFGGCVTRHSCQSMFIFLYLVFPACNLHKMYQFLVLLMKGIKMCTIFLNINKKNDNEESLLFNSRHSNFIILQKLNICGSKKRAIKIP